MHELIFWAGFAGAWLLFAGPIFQASVELRAEADVVDRVRRSAADVARPTPVSAWWWLLPPAHVVLQSRRNRSYQGAVLERLSEEELTQITRYIRTAWGWIYVGLGAWLIAWKETGELVEHREWPSWLFWVLIVLMSLLALGLTASAEGREQAMRARRA